MSCVYKNKSPRTNFVTSPPKAKEEEAISAHCFFFYFSFASFSGLILIGSRRKDSVQSNWDSNLNAFSLHGETDSDLGQFLRLKECITIIQNVAHHRARVPHAGSLIIQSGSDLLDSSENQRFDLRTLSETSASMFQVVLETNHIWYLWGDRTEIK